MKQEKIFTRKGNTILVSSSSSSSVGASVREGLNPGAATKEMQSPT